MQLSSTVFTYWLNWSIQGQFQFALHRDTKLSLQKSCLFLQGFFRGYKLPVNWIAHRCDCVVFKAFSSIQQEGQSEQLLADKHAPSKFPLGLCWFVYSGPALPYLCRPLCICEQYMSGNGASLLLHNLGSALTPQCPCQHMVENVREQS